MKKIVSVFTLMALLLAMCIPVFADEANTSVIDKFPFADNGYTVQGGVVTANDYVSGYFWSDPLWTAGEEFSFTLTVDYSDAQADATDISYFVKLAKPDGSHYLYLSPHKMKYADGTWGWEVKAQANLGNWYWLEDYAKVPYTAGDDKVIFTIGRNAQGFFYDLTTVGGTKLVGGQVNPELFDDAGKAAYASYCESDLRVELYVETQNFKAVITDMAATGAMFEDNTPGDSEQDPPAKTGDSIGSVLVAFVVSAVGICALIPRKRNNRE